MDKVLPIAARILLLLACVFFIGIAAVAFLFAFVNLIGVPMLEASAMHADQGWIAAGTMVLALLLAALVYRISQTLK